MGRGETVERTAAVCGRDVRVSLGGANVRMTEQDLNDPGRGALLHQVRGEGVTERARGDALGDAGTTGRDFDGPLDRAAAQGREESFGLGKSSRPGAWRATTDGAGRE